MVVKERESAEGAAFRLQQDGMARGLRVLTARSALYGKSWKEMIAAARWWSET